ncbi:MAG: UDP-N-acetylmuramate dehydrogenase [Bacteroidota bacterium]
MQQNYPLATSNTFGIDVRAANFASPGSVEELAAIANGFDPRESPLLVIGEGSNILFRRDFDGMVLRPSMRGIELLEDDGSRVVVRVGAAENWDRWVEYAIEKGWYGLENLSLIPGSVGSAPVQNIGAYGSEFRDHMAWLEAWDMQQKQPVRLDNEACRFGYRDSIFKSEEPGRFIITHVAFSLSKEAVLKLGYGNIETAFKEAGGSTPADLREVVISVRNRKLPDPEAYGNAGSFFKNPLVDSTIFKCIRVEHQEIPNYPQPGNQVKIPAAWLIEKAGWKGKRSGNVGTWPSQPLVIVNYGGATGQEIFDFSEKIMEDVDSKFGITLEREVRVVG